MMISRAVYEQLLANQEGETSTREDGSVWRWVYLPNVSVKNANKHQIAGALSYLAETGYYRPADWDEFFGEVRVK